MTLLKAYLMGSKDPFVLAKAFLDDMILKDRQAVEERVNKIFSEAMGKSFEETVEFWKKDITRIKNLITVTKKEKQVLHDYFQEHFMKHPKDKPEMVSGGERGKKVETKTSKIKTEQYRGPKASEKYGLPTELGRDVEVGPTERGGYEAELGEEEREWAYRHKEGEEAHFLEDIRVTIPRTTLNKLDAKIDEFEKELEEAENALASYLKLHKQMMQHIYQTQARTNLEPQHWDVIEVDMIELGAKFLREEIEILQEVYDNLEIPDSKEWMKKLHSIQMKIQNNPSPENLKLLENAIEMGDQQPHVIAEREKKEIEAKLKELKARLDKSEKRVKFVEQGSEFGAWGKKYAGLLVNGELHKLPEPTDSQLVAAQKKKYGEDYGKEPLRTGESTYGSDRWMDIFVGSARTIDNKKAFRRMLSELLESPEIKELLDKDVVRDTQTAAYGADKGGKNEISSGMARFKTQDGVIQTDKKPKYARPAVRLQNLNKLKELFEAAPSGEYDEIVNRVLSSIDNEISAEEKVLEESESKEPKSSEEKAYHKIIKQMPKSLRRYRTGKYPYNFIRLVNELKEEGLQLSDIVKLSEGRKIQGIEQNLENYRDFLQNIVKGTNEPLIKHIKAAWVEDIEEQIDSEDAKIFRDAMYELINDAGYELNNLDVPKPKVSSLKQASSLLKQLQRNYKTYEQLQRNGMDPSEILESMSIEFTALSNKFEEIKEEIPEEIREDLENSINTFNDAFEDYDVKVEVKTAMDKVSWVKRIAEDAQNYAKNNKSLAEGFKDAGIAIEGLEHLEDESMSNEELEKYINARLPTVDRVNYRKEGDYRNALNARQRTINKIIEGKDITRKDLTWVLGKKKYSRQTEEAPDVAFGEEGTYGMGEQNLDEEQGIEIDETSGTAEEIRQRREQAGAFDE